MVRRFFVYALNIASVKYLTQEKKHNPLKILRSTQKSRCDINVSMSTINLITYLHEKKMSISEFAEELGYTRTHISRIVHGHSKPSKRLSKHVYNATKGRVKI